MQQEEQPYRKPSISDIIRDTLIQPSGINYTNAKELFKWHIRSQLTSGYSFVTSVIYKNINCSLPAGPKQVGEGSKLVCPKFTLLFVMC
jgi:hypothetical protein